MQNKYGYAYRHRRSIAALAFCASLILAAAAALATQFAAMPAHAAEPGSSEDPIALKSYVDARISELAGRVEQLASENDELKKTLQAIGGAPLDGADTQPAPSSGAADRFEVITVTADQRMLMGAGTEMVLRTGGAVAIRGEFGSVVDLITGQDLDSGASVSINHLLISARDDSRGVQFTSNAYVLIKGSYSLR